MAVAYWTKQRLDHLRRVTFEGVTGIAEMMEHLVQEADAVRADLIEAQPPKKKWKLATQLSLALKLRKDGVPSLYWRYTQMIGRSGRRHPNWLHIPVSSEDSNKYTRNSLKKYSASPEEFERMWEIEEMAAPLRESLKHCGVIMRTLDKLEKSMRNAQFIDESELSTFDKIHDVLLPLSKGEDVSVTEDEDLTDGGNS